MPKRKREPPVGEEAEGANDRQREELGRKLVHGKKRLNHALKTARAFERQKLSKRIRSAAEEKDGEQQSRLERELDTLKALELPAVAEIHLNKTLSKSKALSAASLHILDVQKSIPGQPLEEAEELARNNVLARLYNAKLVKSEMSSIMNGVLDLLGISTTKAKDSQASTDPASTQHKAKSDKTAAGGLPKKSDTNEGISGSTPHAEVETGELEKAANSEISDEPNYDLGGSSTSSEGDVSDIKARGLSKMSSSQTPKAGYDPSADLSLSDESESRSPTPPPSKSQRSKPKPTSTGDSAFLPSLMMSGYWSGSESAEDVEEEIQPRKNRRGQRARREIWEQKYGSKANHVQKGSRDQGWDPRKGATDGHDRNGRQRGAWSGSGSRPSASGRPSAVTGANDVEVGKRREAEKAEQPLHPSWIAAKKAKEQKKPTAFQGKKVVFD
ncbi:MAG: hypothetical protein M4579_003944 [Chaenotheca gracillima]|nr:MAG: hypothetical protein M4579_003944 [Chaenotheca gracillima]